MNEKKEKMTARVAFFVSLKYGHNSVIWQDDTDCFDENYTLGDEYSRVSEWMLVTFKPLSAEDAAGSQLIALNKLRAKTVDEFKEKLDFIDGRIANLRALTGPSSEAREERA